MVIYASYYGKKNRLHNIAKRSDNEHSWSKFRAIRNLYYNKLKSSKKVFEEQKLQDIASSRSKNSQTWWNSIKSLLNHKNIKDDIPILLDNDTPLFSNLDKANHLTNFSQI
jgi:hypothetical protein